jgi:hypothetical protein
MTNEDDVRDIEEPSRRLGAVVQLGWGLSDQALSSLSNFALAFFIARNTTTRELGAFSLAFAVYIVVLGVSRVISTTPIVIRFSTAEDSHWRQAAAEATGSAVVVGASAGVAAAVVSLLLLDGSLRASVLALAVSLPGLMLQDAWRSAFFAQRKGSKALINDAVWTILLLPTLVVLDGIEGASIGWFMLAWGTAATVAAMIGFIQSRVLPLPHRGIAWWRRHWDLSGWFLGELGVGQGAQNVALFLLLIVSTLETIGSLRAVTLLFGPINIMQMGIGLVAVPEGVRAVRHSLHRLRALVIVMSVLIVGAAGLLGIGLLLIPDEFGIQLLGDSWDAARPLILLQTIFVAATSSLTGPLTGLRALGAAKQTFMGRAWASVPTATLPALGAVALGGAEGILWGAILGEVIALAVWIRQYRSAEKQHEHVPDAQEA